MSRADWLGGQKPRAPFAALIGSISSARKTDFNSKKSLFFLSFSLEITKKNVTRFKKEIFSKKSEK